MSTSSSASSIIKSRRSRFANGELEVEEANNEHNYEIGLKSIDAQVKDRQDERIYRLSKSTRAMVFSGIVIVLLMAFLGVLFWMDKDTVALEILRILVYGGVGSIGGYSIATVKSRRRASGDSAEED